MTITPPEARAKDSPTRQRWRHWQHLLNDSDETPFQFCWERVLVDVAKFKFQGSAADEAFVQRQIAEMRTVAKN
eukprot:5328307-Pyramimonas_sp.AAC.1